MANRPHPTGQSDHPEEANRAERTDFGPNQWLLDEMYARFRSDPESVSEAWQDFLEDYRPAGERDVRGRTDLHVAERAEREEGPPAGPTPAGRREAAEPSHERKRAEPAGDGDGDATPERARAREEAPEEDVVELRGAAAVIAQRMEESLEVPTATSVRTVPARLLEVNRSIVNRHITRKRGRGKVS